jgi:CRP/FNR family transcriptional regulator, anaerobic regulatory protein
MASEIRAIIGHGAQPTTLRRTVACDLCRLRAACLPDHIQDPSAARALSGLVVPGQPQPRGTHLYRQGEPRRSFFFVRSGSAKSFRVNENGQEDVMGFHFPTDMIGAASLEQRQYTESVVLLERSTLCEVPAQELEVLLRNDAALLHSFFSKLAQSFEAERHARVRLHHASADERVADFLLELAARFHAIALRHRQLPGSRGRDSQPRAGQAAGRWRNRSEGQAGRPAGARRAAGDRRAQRERLSPRAQCSIGMRHTRRERRDGAGHVAQARDARAHFLELAIVGRLQAQRIDFAAQGALRRQGARHSCSLHQQLRRVAVALRRQPRQVDARAAGQAAQQTLDELLRGRAP